MRDSWISVEVESAVLGWIDWVKSRRLREPLETSANRVEQAHYRQRAQTMMD